jgi:hypothetical protein
MVGLRRIVKGFRAWRVFKPALPVYRLAEDLACSDLSDEEARAKLRDAALRHPEAARLTRDLTARAAAKAPGYVLDRMHRLVAAVLDDQPVMAIDPRSATDLEAEAALGRLPMREAFARLEAIVPQLARLRADADAWRAAHPGDSQSIARMWHIHKLAQRLDSLVGPRASGGDALSRSLVARRLAEAYLEILLGDTERGDGSTAYFRYAVTPVTRHIEIGFAGR